MKYFIPLPIERFVAAMINDDREVIRLTENWNMERDEVIQILVNHFRSLGIFLVKPLRHSVMIRDSIKFQLRYNQTLKTRLDSIAKEIEKVKTKHTRHSEV